MDDFDLPAPPTAIPARSEGGTPITATTDAPGFGDRFGASWDRRTVETDMWEFAGRIGFELDREIMDALPAPAVDPRPMDALPQDQRPEDIEDVRARMFREGDTAGGNPETRFRAYLLQRAAEAGLTDVPLTIEDHEAEVDRRRIERFKQAQDVLAVDGGGFAGFLGELSRDIADPVNLLLAPLGLGGGFVRTVASETLLGGVAAAASLPRENRVADELGFERPDWLMRIGTEAAASGVLGGVFYGLVKGGQALTRSGRQQTPEPRRGDPVPPVAPHVHRDALDEAGAALEADRPEDLPHAMQPRPSRRDTAAEKPDFDFSVKGNASPRLNPVGYVFGKLLSRELEPHIAAGLLGNLMQESGAGLNVRAVGDNGNSIGIGQWNGPRRKALLAYAKARGEDWPSLDTQIDFFFAEIAGPEARAWSIIRKAPDAATAARLASEHYWRPGIPHTDRRVRYALGVIEQWEGGSVPKGGATAQGFTPSTTQAGYTSAGQVRSAGGMRADIVYEVVDASTLVRASGDLQPRDRTQANSDEWIAKTAAELDPALLMPAPTLDRGAPIIGKDNIIESGNGRVAAVVRAAQEHPDRIDAYRQQIEAAGFDIPADMETPVLVGRRQTEFTAAERRAWVIDGQDSGVARMTATERARAEATTLDAATLAKLDPTRPIDAPENAGFVRAALNRMSRSERNAYTTGGRLNADGAQSLRRSLFARAFNDPDLVRRFAEEDAGELKTLMDALHDASPAWARMTADLGDGAIRPEFDITGHVLEAMRLIARARREAAQDGTGLGAVLAELLNEVDLLEGAVAPLTQALVRRFWKDGRAARREDVADVLTRFANEARKVGAPDTLLAGPDVIDVLRKIDAAAFGDLTEPGAARGITAPPEPDVSAPRMDAEDLGDGAMSDAVEQADMLTAEDLRASFDAAPAGDGIPAGMVAIEEPKAFERQLKDAQPFDTMDELYERAAAAQDFLARIGNEVAEIVGTKFKNPGLKKRPTAEQKMVRKGYASVRDMTDIARGGFLVDSAEQADRLVAELAARAEVFDEGWNVTPAGYFDRKMLVRDPDGTLAEVQIWSPAMFKAKNDAEVVARFDMPETYVDDFGDTHSVKGGHGLYEIGRMQSQPPELRAKAQSAMVELYGEALAAEDASFRALSGSSKSPKVLANIDLNRASDPTTRAVANTSNASTGTQSDPGVNNATASDGESWMAGRPSQSVNTGEVMGTTSSDNIGAAELEGKAAEILADGDFDLDIDGVTMRASEVLDAIEADRQLDEVLQACRIGGPENG